MLFLKLVYDVPNGRGSFKNDFKNKFRVMKGTILPNFLSRKLCFPTFSLTSSMGMVFKFLFTKIKLQSCKE